LEKSIHCPLAQANCPGQIIAVGALVGATVGATVGALVGAAVGALVGAGVTSSEQSLPKD
jgi:hypothetical protein